MQDIKIEFTLEEVTAFIDSTRYKRLHSANTCRISNSEELLAASFMLEGHDVTADTYLTNYTALTSDNYLVTTIIVESARYGRWIKHPHFGFGGSGSPLTTMFSAIPMKLQDEVTAVRWLAKTPKRLSDAITKVLEAGADTIREQQQVISDGDEMLVNAHYNMKKRHKAMFSKAWLKRKTIGCFPWLKRCMEEENAANEL